MAGRGGNKKEKDLDPEEQMRRKFHVKCLFRALGRMTMANAYWLIEATDHYEGLEDVKRRVEQAVRSKGKKKQLLCINDKTLLNKSAEDRTDQEKKYLYRIIGGLKCFKRYPNHVKKKLAAVTYFKYYGPGRTIVRQHHEAHALYFIVTGDVVVSQMIFDELLQQYVSIDIGVMHPGDMFGEVSLLHNIPRTATVTTAGHCELLALMKEDFKNVLQASIQKQWDEVLHAMSAFTYFDALDEVARREGCIVAKMKSYMPNETLFGDGVGVANFVYFILSGQCQVIESMQVIVTTRLGRHYYALYDPYVPQEESEEDFDTKYFGGLKAAEKESRESETTTSVADNTKNHVKPAASKTVKSSLKDLGSEGRLPSALKQDRVSVSNKTESVRLEINEGVSSKIDGSELQEIGSGNKRSEDLLKPTEQEQLRASVRLSVIPEVGHAQPQNLRTYFMQEVGREYQRYASRALHSTFASSLFITLLIHAHRFLRLLTSPAEYEAGHTQDLQYLRTTRCIVCLLNPGSSFGFGENMRDRRIVALTPVSCMLLPKIWLLQRNTANIWTRIQYYLEKKIPTKKQLFKDFVSARRWSEFRDQLVTDVLSRSNTVNWTSVHDVPYSIRMEEMLDI